MYLTTYYVSSAAGNDSNNGTAQTSAFATIQKAADQTKPGDFVEVMSGTYTANTSGGYVLQTANSGAPGAPITYEAAPGAHPILSVPVGAAMGVQINASYVTVRGLEVVGDAQSITQAYAMSQKDNLTNPTTNASGIVVGYSGIPSPPTHVIIEGNIVHDMPGAGIGAGYGDYITVAGNNVYGNAHWSPYAQSGITVGAMRNTDSNTGIKTLVVGNISHDNAELVPNHFTGGITDGEGIIIDTMDDPNTGYSYNGRTLVQNNLTYGNGSSGIQVFQSSHIDVLYNTSANNDSAGVGGGQFTASRSHDTIWENNIASSISSSRPFFQTASDGLTEDNNVLFGGTQQGALGPHDLAADPKFVSPSSGNYQLQNGSPAVDAANAGFSDSTDLSGAARPVGAGNDRGAYEFQGSSPPPPPPLTDTLNIAASEDAYNGDAQFTVAVDGRQVGGPRTASVLHASGSDGHFRLTGNWGGGPHSVQLSFINDAYAGTGKDRNLFVNSIAYDGNSFANTSAAMVANGSRSFTIGGTTPIVAPDKSLLVLHLSEDAYNGDAQFKVSVDGKTLDTAQTVTTLRSSGGAQDFMFGGNFGPGTHDVGVTFLNDAWGGPTPGMDRNLFVNSLEFNANHYGGAVLASNGTQHFTVSS